MIHQALQLDSVAHVVKHHVPFVPSTRRVLHPEKKGRTPSCEVVRPGDRAPARSICPRRGEPGARYGRFPVDDVGRGGSCSHSEVGQDPIDYPMP